MSDFPNWGDFNSPTASYEDYFPSESSSGSGSSNFLGSLGKGLIGGLTDGLSGGLLGMFGGERESQGGYGPSHTDRTKDMMGILLAQAINAFKTPESIL